MKKQLDLFGEIVEEKPTEQPKKAEVAKEPERTKVFAGNYQPYTFYRESPTITWVWNTKT
jgi:hypothetical protein